MQHDERERVLQWLLKVKNFPGEQESLGPSIYDLHTERGESNTTPNLCTNSVLSFCDETTFSTSAVSGSGVNLKIVHLSASNLW